MLVEIEGLEKRYGELRALRGLSLSLERGRIGLLGPNGAGKSTLLKSMLGLVVPDAGVVRVLGTDVTRDPMPARAKIGYMPEGDSVLPELTALEYTLLAAELCGLPRDEAIGRAHQVLHFVGLGEARYRTLDSFSTGMKQRARLAQALVGDPELLLLDEPTSGLDPRGRDEMLAIIRAIPERTGASVILSTHILPDVEKTCDQVIVLVSGEVKYAGQLAPLLAGEEGIVEVRTRGNGVKLEAALTAAGCRVTRDGGKLAVKLPAGESPSFVLKAALGAGEQVRHLAPLEYTLEEAFLRTVQGGAPEPQAADDASATASRA